jgi:hypothetical protein
LNPSDTNPFSTPSDETLASALKAEMAAPASVATTAPASGHYHCLTHTTVTIKAISKPPTAPIPIPSIDVSTKELVMDAIVCLKNYLVAFITAFLHSLIDMPLSNE